jgi:hypothetical protein
MFKVSILSILCGSFEDNGCVGAGNLGQSPQIYSLKMFKRE